MLLYLFCNKSHYENVPFEIPESWAWCRLLDVCHIFGRIGFRGYTKEDLVHSGGAITLSPSNIVNGRMSYDNCTYISWDKYEESPEIQISNNDILLVKTGSSYGKCALVTDLPQAATINPQFVVLKYISYNAALLRYVLQSNYARSNYERFVLGTAIPTFTQVVLGDMLIPLPPANEQIKIIKEIDRWFAIIDEIESGSIELESYVKQTKSKILDLAISGKLVPQDPNDEPAIELLKRINPGFEPCDNSHYENLPFEIPSTWVWVSHNDMLEISGGAQPPKSEFSEVIKPGYIRLYQIRDYGEKPIPIYIPLSTASKTTVKGDILLARYGGSLGKVFIAEDGAYNVAMAKVILCYPEVLNQKFVYYYYLSSIYQNKLRSISRTAQAGFNSGDFEDMYFPLPPLEEQGRIVDAISSIWEMIDMITAEL